MIFEDISRVFSTTASSLRSPQLVDFSICVLKVARFETGIGES